MINLKQLPNISIKESLLLLEKVKDKCLVVVDKNNKLLGTLNDGDLRRAIINGADLDSKISKYIHRKPVFLKIKDSNLLKNQKMLKEIITRKSIEIKNDKIDLIPIVDKNFKVIKLFSTKNLVPSENKNHKIFKNIPVVIMAGGKGTRLGKFSNYFPKPLYPFENSTVIENIINFFRSSGVHKVYLSINFKKDLVKSYFKENKINYVKFLEEKKFLGSAGSLSLVKNKFNKNFFIINCDTISRISLEKFYHYHIKNNFDLTLVAALKKHQFPYGTCKLNRNGELIRIQEKPILTNLSMIGLYLCKSKVINLVKKNTFLGMDDLIKKIKSKKGRIGVFPINEENWIDVGSE